MMRQVLALVLMTAGTAAIAECGGASLLFVESAPRDRFELLVGKEPLRAVRIDLRGSTGQLIFDTENGGTGVEVFQPLRDEGGTDAGNVADGAQALRVVLRDADAGARAAFSIDVDDRLPSSALGQIRVTGGEMAGATVVFETQAGQDIIAVFDTENRAQVCP
jgi:hypothetical protein